ncbi:MAG: nickel insertion protein, partial [Nitrosopumilus sp.]
MVLIIDPQIAGISGDMILCSLVDLGADKQKIIEGIKESEKYFSGSSIKKIEFKKVQSAEIGELYLDEDTTFEFDYWQNGFEGNNSLGGWLTF